MSNRLITLIAPARFVDDEVLDGVVMQCRSHGFEARISENCRLRHHQFAGTDEERAETFIHEWNEGNAEFLWCVRGGYGCGRLLPIIRDRLRVQSKFLIGYSDETFLLAHIAKNRLGIPVHGPMPDDIRSDRKSGVFEALFEKIKSSDFSGSLTFEAGINCQILQSGHAKGHVIVGNLSILTRLIGALDEPDWNSAILIVEDIGEYFYAIDRMFLHLREAGVLKKIAGLCLGDYTNMQDNEIPFGYSVEEIAFCHLGDRDIPVVAGLPIGHGADNFPIVFGAEGVLIASEFGVTLTTSVSVNPLRHHPAL